jgi:hypothetical protein
LLLRDRASAGRKACRQAHSSHHLSACCACGATPGVGEPLPQTQGCFGTGVLLISAHVHLIDVSRTVCKVLVQRELASLGFRLCTRHCDFRFASFDLRLNNLILKLINSRLVFVGQVDVQFGNFQQLNANACQIRRALNNRAGYVWSSCS